ncbi:MAG: response regulator, partial [Chloroflexi bacterium]
MSAGAGARILVIDDEPSILRALRTNLNGHGFRVTTAASGREGLDAYKR